MLNEKYHIGHATIQFECNDHREVCCEIDGLYCRMDSVNEKRNGHHHDSSLILSDQNL
jgi:hypothetical protein